MWHQNPGTRTLAVHSTFSIWCVTLRGNLIRQLQLVAAGEHSQGLASLKLLSVVGTGLYQHQRRWRLNILGPILTRYAM